MSETETAWGCKNKQVIDNALAKGLSRNEREMTRIISRWLDRLFCHTLITFSIQMTWVIAWFFFRDGYITESSSMTFRLMRPPKVTDRLPPSVLHCLPPFLKSLLFFISMKHRCFILPKQRMKLSWGKHSYLLQPDLYYQEDCTCYCPGSRMWISTDYLKNKNTHFLLSNMYKHLFEHICSFMKVFKILQKS